MAAVCSPHAFHAEQAIAACRAGKHLILVEKPLAASRVEALEVARVAKGDRVAHRRGRDACVRSCLSRSPSGLVRNARRGYARSFVHFSTQQRALHRSGDRSRAGVPALATSTPRSRSLRGAGRDASWSHECGPVHSLGAQTVNLALYIN